MVKVIIIKKVMRMQISVTNHLYNDACPIIDQALQSAVYRAVNETLFKRSWLLGMRIQYEVLKEQREEYGEHVVKKLTKELTVKYGNGYFMEQYESANRGV